MIPAKQEGGVLLSQIFREAGRPLLMPYAVGGYPDRDGTPPMKYLRPLRSG
jgi:hypothetical protein